MTSQRVILSSASSMRLSKGEGRVKRTRAGATTAEKQQLKVLEE
jgi:hypothetical protein